MDEELDKLCRSRKTEDRMKAVSRLAALSSESAQAALIELLDDKVNYIAALAAAALEKTAEDSAAAKLLEKFNALMKDGLGLDPGCHIRSPLALAFARLDYRFAEDALRAGMKAVQVEAVGGALFDTAMHLRANCALALAQIRARDVVRDIALLLFDRSGTPGATLEFQPEQVKMPTRKAAAQALGISGDAAAIIPLAIRLAYPDGEMPDVLQECMQAVIELEDERALELLTPYLSNKDASLVSYAALMIARTRDAKAPALLKTAVANLENENAIQAVLFALTTLRTPEGFAALYTLAGSQREVLRRASVEVLETLPYPESREILERMASSDKNAMIRLSAKRALAAMGSP